MSTFELLPAIDLRAGRVVRLREGDFARMTAYESDPRSVARAFAEAGAERLHMVDLDGAREGRPRQLDLVGEVVKDLGGRARVELGGGLRTPEDVAAVLDLGVSRVAVGTAALRDPAFAAGLVARHGPGRIVGSIDVRAGLALGEGWRAGAAGLPAAEAITMLADAGITTFEVTAIDRDGLLAGPDLDLMGALVSMARGGIIASGGIASIEDVLALRAAGCAGAIVGRALYVGQVELRALVSALAQGRSPA
jgi:phosphoribosylformimino-5-aminoimidazole carboxamide ribotide isomerase